MILAALPSSKWGEPRETASQWLVATGALWEAQQTQICHRTTPSIPGYSEYIPKSISLSWEMRRLAQSPPAATQVPMAREAVWRKQDLNRVSTDGKDL